MDCMAAGALAGALGNDVSAGAPAPTTGLERPADASLCMTCPVRSTCIGGMAAQAGTRQLLGALAGWRRLRAGDTVVLPFPALHAVRSGSLKSVAFGGEAGHLRGLHFAGELVGAAGVAGGRDAIRLVALEDTELCALRYDPIGTPGAVMGRVWDMMSRELLRERVQSNWLACLLPERRVPAFLASIAVRVRAHGAASRGFRLHLSEAEICSYLEVPAAMLGRVLAALARRGVLEVGSKHIGILQPEVLRREVYRA
jgi:CRP/FNR family transcriptional regulator